MQNGDEGLPYIILADSGIFVKMSKLLNTMVYFS